MKYAWLCHPATLAATLVLLVNDHVLKQAWPGFVTGKLSDVAGLLVAPALLSLLLLRRADLTATLLTGTLFTLAKTTQTGAEAASQAWTLIAGPSRILADPTDLLALPALALAWWIRNHSHQVTRQWRIMTGVPLAVLAVGATSPVPGPPSADVVYVTDGHVVVEGYFTTASSADGGRTWALGSGPAAKAPGKPQTLACVARRCYRIAPDRLKVLQSDDSGATWATSWELSPGRTEWVRRALADPEHPTPRLRSHALAVQERPEGHVVVVANGRDGVAVRDTAGTWRRHGFTPDGGLSTSAASSVTGMGLHIGDELRVAVLGGFWILVAGLLLAMPGRRRSGVLVLGLALIGVVLLLPWRFEEWYGYDTLIRSADMTQAAFQVTGGVLVLGTLVSVLSAARRERLGAEALRRVLWVAVLVTAGLALPFHGWTLGRPDDYRTALVLAALYGLGTGAAGLTVIRRNAAPAPGRPAPGRA
ncbi:hypothetical protein [Nonomuraea typhae]|uniref:hypothetical protein n=1 Tax=Nonomuraea typhae TaxID=2603600 RepID=UPI0015E1FF37|nr:hypothetical protein [Nonomuraea typhae]